jgi:predicted porin
MRTRGSTVTNKLLFAAAMAGLPLAAHAQSGLTLYGVADAAFALVDSGGGSAVRHVDSGVQDVSRFGIRGTEQLAGTLQALFDLDAEVRTDSGEGDGAAGGLTFQRRSVVGLRGNFGEVRLGRDYTPGYHALLDKSIVGTSYYGSPDMWKTAGGIDNRASNGIFYDTPTIGNLQLRLAYAMGEYATEPKNRGKLAAAALFYGKGPVRISGYYQQVDSTSDPYVRTKQYGLGGGYDFGRFAVRGGYAASDPDGGNRLWHYSVGASAKIGTGTLYAQLISIEQEASAGSRPKATTFALAYRHPLSARTNLYASFGSTTNNEAGNFSLNSAADSFAPTAVGEDLRAFGLGIAHVF